MKKQTAVPVTDMSFGQSRDVINFFKFVKADRKVEKNEKLYNYGKWQCI